MLVSRWLATSAILPLLLGAACTSHKPVISEQTLKRIRSDYPGITKACLDDIRYGKPMPNRVDKCFKMTPAQQWRGLWRDDFEGSVFCPAPARHCNLTDPSAEIWLSFADASRPNGKQPTSRLYQVTFVGRQTMKPGGYGHMGLFKYEVIVDHLLKFAPIPEQ